MRQNLSVGVACLVIVLVTAGILGIATRQPERVYDASCRSLDADVGFYEGRLVRLQSSGMERTDNPNELMCRIRTDRPPLILCEFRVNVPSVGQIKPQFIVGRCKGRKDANGPVIVVDCSFVVHAP